MLLSRALICPIVAVNSPVPLKMSVFSAKKQKISRAMKWFITNLDLSGPRGALHASEPSHRSESTRCARSRHYMTLRLIPVCLGK